MTLKTLGLAALLATMAACGSEMTTSGGNLSGVSGSGTSDPSDGGTPADAGTSNDTCDCSGMALPSICMVCSTGETACAHFVCDAGTCEVAMCQ